MFVVSNLIAALAGVLEWTLSSYMWVVIARSLVSWVSPDPYNPIVQFLCKVTEPVLEPIRRRMGYGMGLDLSPVVVLITIMFLKQFLVRSLHEWAARIG